MKNNAKTDNFFDHVYEIVRTIPRGKVLTYGAIARQIGSRDARKIGWALHANTDPNTPCHRVVNKVGRLAPNFAFDGWHEQKRRLQEEGVTFSSEMVVDLKKHRWDG